MQIEYQAQETEDFTLVEFMGANIFVHKNKDIEWTMSFTGLSKVGIENVIMFSDLIKHIADEAKLKQYQTIVRDPQQYELDFTKKGN